MSSEGGCVVGGLAGSAGEDGPVLAVVAPEAFPAKLWAAIAANTPVAASAPKKTRRVTVAIRRNPASRLAAATHSCRGYSGSDTSSILGVSREETVKGRCEPLEIGRLYLGRVGVRPKGVSRGLDTTFRVGVTLKGIDGALETIGGLVLLFVRPATLNHIARTLTQHELSEDPHDFVARHLLRSAQHLAHGTTLFAAVYLLSHGLSKLVLVVAVLQGHSWAYPAIIALLGVFIIYQCYRLAYRFSVGLALLTAFDAFIVWLTWREWRARVPAGSDM